MFRVHRLQSVPAWRQHLHIQAGFSPVQVSQVAARVVYLPKAAEDGSILPHVAGELLEVPSALQRQLERAAKGAGSTCVVYPTAPVAGASTVVFVGTGSSVDEVMKPAGKTLPPPTLTSTHNDMQGTPSPYQANCRYSFPIQGVFQEQNKTATQAALTALSPPLPTSTPLFCFHVACLTVLESATAAAVASLNALEISEAVFELPTWGKEPAGTDTAEAVTRSAILSGYKFDKHFTGDRVKPGLERVTIEGGEEDARGTCVLCQPSRSFFVTMHHFYASRETCADGGISI